MFEACIEMPCSINALNAREVSMVDYCKHAEKPLKNIPQVSLEVVGERLIILLEYNKQIKTFETRIQSKQQKYTHTVTGKICSLLIWSSTHIIT